MRTDKLTVVLRVAGFFAVCLLITSCDQAALDPEIESWVAQSQTAFTEAVTDAFSGELIQPTLHHDRVITRLDDDRFPGWARSTFDACVYWSVPYTRMEYVIAPACYQREWSERPGRAWGWILVGDGEVHILELSRQDEGENSEVIKPIDAWNDPDAEF